MSPQELKIRLETKGDGHDFFSREMCEHLRNDGISDEALIDYLAAADLPINPWAIAIARSAAHCTVNPEAEAEVRSNLGPAMVKKLESK